MCYHLTSCQRRVSWLGFVVQVPMRAWSNDLGMVILWLWYWSTASGMILRILSLLGFWSYFSHLFSATLERYHCSIIHDSIFHYIKISPCDNHTHKHRFIDAWRRLTEPFVLSGDSLSGHPYWHTGIKLRCTYIFCDKCLTSHAKKYDNPWWSVKIHKTETPS